MTAAKKSYSRSISKFESRIELPGSYRKPPAGRNLGNTSLNEVIEVLVKIRRKTSIRNFIKGLGTGKNKPLSRELFDRRFGTSAEYINLVVTFTHQHDLIVVQTSVSKRSVILKGPVQKFTEAFQVYLVKFSQDSGIPYRGRSGAIHIPEMLKDIFTGVFGLDNRPQARPMFHIHPKIYATMEPVFKDITVGNNITAKSGGYTANAGWGACTGLGVPLGNIVQVL
jgi:kumamolisin